MKPLFVFIYLNDLIFLNKLSKTKKTEILKDHTNFQKNLNFFPDYALLYKKNSKKQYSNYIYILKFEKILQIFSIRISVRIKNNQ